MKKIIITFVLLAMVALVPAVSFASENSNNSGIKQLKNIAWGESYHDFSTKYSIKPLLETCEITLDEKVNLYGQEMDTRAVACFYNDRLFMIQYCFPEKLTDEEFDKLTEVMTKELGEVGAKNENNVIGEMKGWKNNDELIALNKEGIYYIDFNFLDTDKLCSLEKIKSLNVNNK